MGFLMGIDLGTSSVKTLIVDDKGKTKAIARQEYPIDIPRVGHAEQDPEVWWQATAKTVRQAIHQAQIDVADLKSVGLSGQMHGMVLIDRNFEVVRPAIIWSDQRSKQEVDEINLKVGKEALGKITLNTVAAGFQTPSVLWVLKNEPHHYEKTFKILLPKDYIRLKLTGEIGTDITDASSTLAFDTVSGRWSSAIINRLGLNMEKYPDCKLSYEVAGEITDWAAKETGLAPKTPVVFGGGDQPMQAIGNGIIYPGYVAANIGTGGQISTLIEQPLYDEQLRTNTFCNVLPKTWNIMGAILAAGLSLKWLTENLFKDYEFANINQLVRQLPAGSEGLVFLPYITGERTPHMDPYARGVFFGLTLSHTAANFVKAVMEGVTFALRDSMEIFTNLGIRVDRVIASGGGAKNAEWLDIQANVFNKEIYTTKTVEQACLGAAIVAGVGTNIYSSIREGCSAAVQFNEQPIIPTARKVDKYNEIYPVFKELYSRNKDLFPKLQ